MKKIAIIILLAISTVASATSWYISPSGNDNNNGTIASPFFTLNKAWSVVQPGDIIYARGGVYKFDQRQNLTGKNGTSSSNIKIWAYENEKPVFTKSSSFVTPSWPVSLIYVKANFIHLKGIEVSGFTQKTSTIWYGIAVQGSNYDIFEQISSHHNGHGMVIRDESNHNLVLNSDFHHNADPLTSGDAYGNADGLEIGYQSSSMENTVRGCRIWMNSDDGIDLWDNNGNVIIDRCWSWKNGYREDGRTAGGDGGGFKFGKTSTQNGSSFKRTVTNCISVYNRNKGFNQNGANVKFYFYNNLSYKNVDGFVFYDYNLANVFRNNICFGNTTEDWTGTYSNSTRDHNSYDPAFSPTGPVASASDFLSVDTTGISGLRKASGDLPNLDFMKLAAGSDLIDAGVNTGMMYAGNAPDLGPFESGNAVAAAPQVSEQPKPETASAEIPVITGSEQVSLSPYPAKDVISIKNFVQGNTAAVLKLFDFSGKVCQESPIANTSSPQIALNVNPGCYIARIMTGDEVKYVQKVIIVK
ncbi:MAG TPA: right-handed parallel beta-helix repeat-containing protein [Bacteroidales bacterium]|nr:right-handed parallel beta-helix repeat-containing protein [Bacteroidales bacterium]